MVYYRASPREYAVLPQIWLNETVPMEKPTCKDQWSRHPMRKQYFSFPTLNPLSNKEDGLF
jgi:hypothetical protein